MPDSNSNLTQLLRASASGDRRDLDALMAAIYNDMRRFAMSHMKAERDDHTLQPTALVHEAYIKLIDQRSTDWRDRMHFFAIASRIIRRILVDHARERLAQKRGGDRQRVPLEDVDSTTPVSKGGASDRAGAGGVNIVALDEALTELHDLDPQQAHIVELRYFSGLTLEEVADLLSIGRRTVDREWQCARAWLYCRLGGDAAGCADA